MNPKTMWTIAGLLFQWYLSRPQKKATPPVSEPSPGTMEQEEQRLRVQLMHDPRSLGVTTPAQLQDRYNRSLEAGAAGDMRAAVSILKGAA